MTETERNELVEKLTARNLDSWAKASGGSLPIEMKGHYVHVVCDIESLGYEIIKKEHLKPLQGAFVLQEVRAGRFKIFRSEAARDEAIMESRRGEETKPMDEVFKEIGIAPNP